MSSHSSRHLWTRRGISSRVMTPSLIRNRSNLTLIRLKISKIIILKAPILTNSIKLVKHKIRLQPQKLAMTRQRSPLTKTKVKTRKRNPQSSTTTKTKRKKAFYQHPQVNRWCFAHLTLLRRRSKCLLRLPLELQLTIRHLRNFNKLRNSKYHGIRY